MTLQQFQRRSARVEAMRLDSVADLAHAGYWLEAHGIPNVPQGAHLYIYSLGQPTLARLGQWLTYDPATGAFEVHDGGADRPEGHDEVRAAE